MRIALVAHSVNKRFGVPRCVAELLARLSLEHDVTLFASSLQDVPRHSFRFVKIPALPASRAISQATFIGLSAVYVRVWRTIHNLDFEIVHSTVGPGPGTNVATFHFCQEAEWRLVEGTSLATPVGLSRFDSIDYNLYRRLMRWREWKAFKRNNLAASIVVSERMRQDVLRCYGDCSGEMFVIPNGVDVQEFHPGNRENLRAPVRKRYNIAPTTPVILFVGGDWERKGLSIAMNSLTQMERKDATLLVVGTGDMPPYLRLADKLGIVDRLIFAGSTNEVAAYYAAADVMVLPSLYEPFGLVVPEAMASGLPVIVTANVGASYLVEDGREGFVFAGPPYERALAKAMDILCGDVKRRAEMGEMARRKAEKLSWESVASETMRVYRHIVTPQSIQVDREKSCLEVSSLETEAF